MARQSKSVNVELSSLSLPGAYEPSLVEKAAAAARRKRRRVLVRRSKEKKPRTTLLISPTVAGVQEVARRWRLGQILAIPTECTYEVGMRLSTEDWRSGMQRLREYSGTQTSPHMYVTTSSLADPKSSTNSFLGWQMPEHKYAFRRKDRTIVSLHSFSESMQVLKRVAAKVWPGPVVLKVASQPRSPPPSPTSVALPTIQTPSTKPTTDDSYLTLRCPCHPLAVKVSQEFYNNADDLLVGIALLQDNDSHVTQASAVTNMTVLNGEERLEIFTVPTCEHGKPYPVSIWMDETVRQVRIRGCSSFSSPQHLTCESILQAIHAPKGKTHRDKVIQAVLQKWNVVQEE